MVAIQIKKYSKYIFNALNSSVNEIVIELLLFCKYGKKLTNNDLSSKQRKLLHLDKEYRYSKEIIEKNNRTITLYDACIHGYETIVKCLVQHGANVQGNVNALAEACENGHETIVKCLVEHGADVQGNTKALKYACFNGHETIVKYLVEHGANIQGNKHALYLACRNGHEIIVKYLVEQGANIQGSRDALSQVCYNGH